MLTNREHGDASSTVEPIVLVAFKDECGLEGPAVLLCIERPHARSRTRQRACRSRMSRATDRPGLAKPR